MTVPRFEDGVIKRSVNVFKLFQLSPEVQIVEGRVWRVPGSLNVRDDDNLNLRRGSENKATYKTDLIC